MPAIARDGSLKAYEAQAAATHGVDYLDLTDVICPTDPCPVVAANGAVIYQDKLHLTNTFSASVGRLMAARLESLYDW